MQTLHLTCKMVNHKNLSYHTLFQQGGEPRKAANPRKSITKPNAFVSFSKPNKSTNIIEVSEIHPAEK